MLFFLPNFMKTLHFFALILLMASCSETKDNSILNKSDYDAFLHETGSELRAEVKRKKEKLNTQLGQDSTDITALGGLAAVYSSLFEATGEIENLKLAEQALVRGLEVSAFNKDGYAIKLAKNYISQHRFKDAKALMEKTLAEPSNKYQVHLILFDIYMELAEYAKASEMLGLVENEAHFDYLIRRSKWADYKGNLDEAIRYMEKAKKLADESGKPSLKVWAYTNIADYYGHAGRLEDSYQHYIKALQIDSANAYAKKGLAWIAYSHEGDIEEANRILNAVLDYHVVPDYYLLKGDMASTANKPEEAGKNYDQFVKAAEKKGYGEMYNAYLIEYYAERAPDKALAIAEREIENRATPEAYHLLALAQLKSGMKAEALATIENHVAGKTFEPMAEFHSALVYKANGMGEKVAEAKKELSGAGYEIGPEMAKEVSRW